MGKPKINIGAAIFAYSATMLLGSLVVIINATMVPLAGTYAIDLPRAGLLLSCIGIGRIGMQGFGGALADKVGRKVMCLCGMFIMLIFFATLPFSKSFLFSAALCALAGIGYGMLNTASLALIYDCFAPSGRNAVAQSYVQLLFASGGVLTPLAANRLLEGGLFWGNLYWGCAALTFIMICATLALRFPATYKRAAVENGFQQQPELLRDGLLLCSQVFLVYCMGFVCTTWLPMLAVDRIEFSENQSVLALSLYNVGSICGTLLFAQLLKRHHALKFMIMNPAVAMAALSLCIFSKTPALFLTGIFIGGFTIAIVFNMGIGLGGEMFGARAGAITGMISTASSVSALLTPAVTGLFLDRYGVRTTFMSVYLLGIAGIAVGLVLRRRYQALKGH